MLRSKQKVSCHKGSSAYKFEVCLFFSVIILVMNRRDVVHNLLQAKELNMYNGEYAFISISYDLSPGKKW